MIYYCTCRSKTHKGFHECAVDSEKCCIECGYYATRSIVRVTTESNKDFDINGKAGQQLRTKELTRYLAQGYKVWER